MNTRAVLSGNQAIARGFWEAGGVIAASYPGSPTVEIMESLSEYPEVLAQWALNEKVALEIAIGGSFAGARALASMKHVGVNIAADPFMTFTQINTKGGFVLVVGDDPGLSSSQNEQDSRFFAKFANAALLEPSTAQEAKDYVMAAFEISEQFGTPVVVRLTSTLCHSRGVVTLGERREPLVGGFTEDQARYCMLPPYANKQQLFMRERLERLRQHNNTATLNTYTDSGQRDYLIITSGVSYQYLRELKLNLSVLKLGMSFPLPVERIREIAAKYRHILVIEELMPFIETELRTEGLWAQGKQFFSVTGELTTDHIRAGLVAAGVIEEAPKTEPALPLPPRTPMLCAGCPHRPVFDILKKLKATVIGDIGCYSLGILEPFEVLKTNLSMGASLGIIQGVARAHHQAGITKPLVATIGDGTFFHSGLAGFADIAKSKDNITIVVLDNRTTAMTGGQATPTTADFTKEQGLYGIDIPAVLKAFGITDVTVVDQFDYLHTRTVIRSAMERQGLSVVVTTRPCALNFKLKESPFYVDTSICISCRTCIGVNCPPISMQAYPGDAKKKSFIDPDMCVGCSVCSQVCPVKAIKRTGVQ